MIKISLILSTLVIVLSTSILDSLNTEYYTVSGELIPLYTKVSEVYEFNNSTSMPPFTILLVNNSLTESLEIHKFEYNSSDITQIVSHFVPDSVKNNKYDIHGIIAVLEKMFKFKGKDIAVIEENEMKIEAYLTYNENIDIKLCETKVIVGEKFFKLYALTASQNASFYLLESSG